MSDDPNPRRGTNSPENASARVRLKDVLEIDAFRKIAEGYAELDAIGIALFDSDGERIAQVGPTRLPLCELLNAKAIGSARCKSQLGEVGAARPLAGTRSCSDCFTGYKY